MGVPWKAAVCAAALAANLPIHAAIVPVDNNRWLHAPETGLYWLHLEYTRGLTFEQASSYEGHRWATDDELGTFYANLGLYDGDIEPVLWLAQHWGSLAMSRAYVGSFYWTVNGGIGGYQLWNDFENGGFRFWSLDGSLPHTPAERGAALVRSQVVVVPEPGTWALMLMGLALVALHAFRSAGRCIVGTGIRQGRPGSPHSAMCGRSLIAPS